MAKGFKYTLDRRIVDRILIWLISIGKGPESYYLLTVPGRKTGRFYTKPVVLIEGGGNLWLVAPYGNVDWVKNARSAGEVTLSQGKNRQTWLIRELPPAEASLILKDYLRKYPITAPFFAASADSPLDDFKSEAKAKPVFALIPKEGET